MMANLPGCSGSNPPWYCGQLTETYGESYNGSTEHGNDIALPVGTPVTALYGGTVINASYQPWGGQVGIRANVPGYGTLNEYVQHLDMIAGNIKAGAQVAAGDVLGTSGGQLSGGNHPASAQYSSGPHIEFGFGAPWIGGGANPDSLFAINAARAGALPSGGQGAGGGNIVSDVVNGATGGALDNVNTFFGNVNGTLANPQFWQRIAIGGGGAILLIGALFLLFRDTGGQASGGGA